MLHRCHLALAVVLLPHGAAAERFHVPDDTADAGHAIVDHMLGTCVPEHVYEDVLQRGDFNGDGIPDFAVRKSYAYGCADDGETPTNLSEWCGSAGCSTSIWVSEPDTSWTKIYDRSNRGLDVVQGANVDLFMVYSHPFGARCETVGVYPCPVYHRFEDGAFIATEPELPRDLRDLSLAHAELQADTTDPSVCHADEGFEATALPHHRWAILRARSCEEDGWNWGGTAGPLGVIFSRDGTEWEEFHLGSVHNIWFEPGDDHPDITSRCPPTEQNDTSCIGVARHHSTCAISSGQNEACVSYYRYNARPWRLIGTNFETEQSGQEEDND